MTLQEMENKLEEYLNDLVTAELSIRTQKKYLRDIMRFLTFCNRDRPFEKSGVIEYKQHLLQKYKVSTTNSYLISLNRFLCWMNLADCTVKTVRTQRRTGLENVMSLEEYIRMLKFCLDKHKDKNYLLLRTMASTGIRVGELAVITREAAKRKTATVTHKGKCRRIFIPTNLARLLLEYCQKQGIESGVIFCGKRENVALHPSGVWKMLKRIASAAGVDPDKIYPHNLRHLFAKTYMEKVGNIFELADLLGHSNVEITRIYALTSNAEKHKSIDSLML